MEIRVLYINETTARFVNVENDNKSINELLGWDDAWNTPTIKVRGRDYIIICSDLGKVRHEKVTCLSYDNIVNPASELREPFIVGSVVVTKFDGIDDFESLNDKDVELLESRLFSHGKPYLKDFNPMLLIID